MLSVTVFSVIEGKIKGTLHEYFREIITIVFVDPPSDPMTQDTFFYFFSKK